MTDQAARAVTAMVTDRSATSFPSVLIVGVQHTAPLHTEPLSLTPVKTCKKLITVL